MFKINYQIVNKPIYQPPLPQIQIQPKPTINLGGIFAALKPSGPCPSCG
jgi:hypothetical protein